MFTRRRPSYKRTTPYGKRKPSYKRRKTSYKKRRAGAVAKRRFPTARPRVALVAPNAWHPDKEICKMRSTTRFRYTCASLTGIADAVGITDHLTFYMNDIYRCNGAWSGTLATTNGSAITSPFVFMDPAQGFNTMSAMYTMWQVRGAKITVKMYENIYNTVGTSQQQPMQWAVVPMSDTLAAGIRAFPATTPFRSIVRSPGASRVKTFAQQAYGTAGAVSTNHTFSVFSSPSKVMSFPVYYGRSGSYGLYTTSPADSPCFMIVGSHIDPFTTTTPYFDMEVSIEYSVVWSGRGLTPIVGEERHPDPIPTDDSEMDEKTFDALSLREEKKDEKKEEKKTEAKGWFS